jgi:hypothetical protein
MKSFSICSALLLLLLPAGCTSTGTQTDAEQLMGQREQNLLLAKARPLQEFGLSPSFPYGNQLLYLGATLLETEQSAIRSFEPGQMPLIQLEGASPRKQMTVLLDTAANASWMQYSSAAENGVIFLQNDGRAIPYLGKTGPNGASAFAGIIPLLKIDQLTLNKTPFYIRMARGTMQPATYTPSAPRVDAVLGYDNLRQFRFIQFDISRGTVRMSTSTRYTPSEERLIGTAGISTLCRDSLAVDGSVFGTPTPIVLDFAGDFAFARGDTRAPVTQQLELGEVVFVKVPTTVLAVQDKFPRAGRQLLKQYIVTICPRQGVVYFERPSL